MSKSEAGHEAGREVTNPFSKGYKTRYGDPVSDACGDHQHAACTQDYIHCHCTYRGLHTIQHAYANTPIAAQELGMEMKPKCGTCGETLEANTFNCPKCGGISGFGRQAGHDVVSRSQPDVVSGQCPQCGEIDRHASYCLQLSRQLRGEVGLNTIPMVKRATGRTIPDLTGREHVCEYQAAVKGTQGREEK